MKFVFVLSPFLNYVYIFGRWQERENGAFQRCKHGLQKASRQIKLYYLIVCFI